MSSSSWSLSLRPTVDTRNLCATGPPAFGAITDAEEDAGETIIDHIMNPTQNPENSSCCMFYLYHWLSRETREQQQ